MITSTCAGGAAPRRGASRRAAAASRRAAARATSTARGTACARGVRRCLPGRVPRARAIYSTHGRPILCLIYIVSDLKACREPLLPAARPRSPITTPQSPYTPSTPPQCSDCPPCAMPCYGTIREYAYSSVPSFGQTFSLIKLVLVNNSIQLIGWALGCREGMCV